MNIILFSRKQVNHRPEQLRTILREIERYNMDYVVNEEFAAAVESLTDIRIDASHLFSGKPLATGNDIMVTYGGDGTPQTTYPWWLSTADAVAISQPTLARASRCSSGLSLRVTSVLRSD